MSRLMGRRPARHPLGRILVSLAIVVLAGCGPTPPVVIGFIGGTSGRVADLGIAGRDAVVLAVAERNAAGGIAGRPVKLVVKDDAQDPATARRALRELIDAGAVAVVGPMTSAIAVAVQPIADEARLLMMSPTASTDELSGRDDYFFRVNASAKDNARRVARHHATQGKLRRLAVVLDLGNRAYAQSWLASFRDAFAQDGGQVVREIGFESGSETTFNRLVAALSGADIDGLLIIANSMDTALLCQQVRKLGITLPIVTSEWAATERLIELGGRSVEGVVVAQNFDRDSATAGYRGFADAYRARFRREPGFGGVIAYDAANVVLEALASRRPGDGVKETLLATRRFDGVMEAIVFDDFGDVTRSIYMTVVRDGRFAPVH